MIITMTQKKGGAGKSTIAVSMAACLQQSGYDVGLLDCDPQQTSMNWVQRRDEAKIDAGYDGSFEGCWVSGDIRDNIKGMAERNHHVIIDAPGFDTQELRYAMALSDMALTPFRPTQFDLEAYTKLLEVYDLMSPVNPNLQLAAVINAAPTHHMDKHAKEAREYLMSKGIQCLEALAYYRCAWVDCTYDGRGVSEYGDQKANTEITNIVSEVLTYDNS